MRRGHRLLPPRKRAVRLTLNGQPVDNRYVTMDSFAQSVYGNEPVSITLPAQSGDGGTSFTEPDYYPDYAENEDAPILPTLLLAALSALVLVRAKKRLCR